MRRLLVWLLSVAIALVLAVVAGGYVYLRQSLPVVTGDVEVPDLAFPIDIVRDADAVPHIFAASARDAFFGLGYVHAQDRLWQMEFQRRVGRGRLSEIFGAATVPQDRFLRTVGFGRAADSAWSNLPADVRDQIGGYVKGVNAFISSHRGRRLPPEFTLLRFEPEPFTGSDVLVWVKMMAWDLSANYSLELMRHDLAASVGAARMEELLPPYPVDGLSIVSNSRNSAPGGTATESPARATLNGLGFRRPETAASARPSSLWAALDASLTGTDQRLGRFLIGGGQTESIGSNNWVVDGTLTASGKPLLANDPHLGAQVPSLWYLAHLSAGDFEVVGATLPGAPALAIGRNKFIAWGETNVAADVQDLYLERIDPSGSTAEFRGVQEPIRTIPETILVKGGPAVEVQVRITRHGPLISDAINANNAAAPRVPAAPVLEPMAFRWTALDPEDSTIASFLRLNVARNWDEFVDALRDYNAPAQNFVYADVEGHIGYYAPGRIPVRAGGDGSRPSEGWTGASEWTGWIPFTQLPHTFDPPEHFIVTANHRPMPAGYPYLIALEYPEPYRAQRITDLLAGRTGLTPEDFRKIQADTVSLHARTLLPLLLQHVRSDSPAVRQAVETLQGWNFDGRGDSAAEAIFQAWFHHLAPALVGDELGPRVLDAYAGRFSYITRLVSGLAQGRTPQWCDEVSTPALETCEQTLTKGLEDALVDLERRLGSDIARWRWDRAHRAIFPHLGLDAVAPLRPFLSRSAPGVGDWSTVNVGPVAVRSPYDQTSVPGYRQIVDLSPANDSRFLDAVGQSGHFLSPRYDDSLQDWQAVRPRPMRMDRAEIERGATGRLRLLPKTEPR